MIENLILIGFLFLSWAFFAGTETALVSADRLKLKNLEKKGNKKAKIALFLIKKPERLLITVLIGTNLSLVFAANLTARLFYELYGRPRPLSSVVTITLLSLLLCEILPKNFAFKNNIKFTLFSAYPLIICYYLFYPAVFILSVLTRIIIKMAGLHYTGLIPSLFKEKEDVKIFIKSSIGSQFSVDQTRYFVDSLEFGSKKLSDVQVPLIEMKAIEENNRVGKAIDFIRKTHKSVIPVYRGRIDNIVGVIFPKSLIGVDRNKSIKDIMVEPYFVPESKSINELYREMFIKDLPVVFGVDEHGGITGLATIYDIGEEIIGKITSIDEKKNLIVRIKKNEYLVDGDVEIEEINHILNVDIDTKGFTTLNGLLSGILGKIPEKGDIVKLDNIKIIVEKASKKRAELLRIIKM